jgi:hypothetical protein
MTWPANFYAHERDVAQFCEGEHSQAVCTPHGNVRFSKRCANSPEGLAFTRALLAAAVREWPARRVPPSTGQDTSSLTEGTYQ